MFESRTLETRPLQSMKRFTAFLPVCFLALAAALSARADWVIDLGIPGAQGSAQFSSRVGEGYELDDLTGFEAGGQARLVFVWNKRSTPEFKVYFGQTTGAIEANNTAFAADGFRPVRLDAYSVNRQDRF